MIVEQMEALGRHRSVIREIFAYSLSRSAEIGEENVFDFSLGNPSVPAPPVVGETLARLLRETPPAVLHGYTPANGDARVRAAIADYLQKSHACPAEADDLYLTAGAAAALTISLHAVCRAGEEVVVFAPFFPNTAYSSRGQGRGCGWPRVMLPPFCPIPPPCAPRSTKRPPP